MACFRAYDSPQDSFRDYCRKLMTNPRYKPLFQYGSFDYENWALGLQSCGYATDPDYARKLIRVMPSLADKKRAVEIARQIETEISAYLSMITLINVLLGLAVWGLMSLIGIPNPLLWGVLATFTNYIPYLGAIVMILVLAMVGFITFDDIGQALLAPGAFIGLNILESYILTPLILGRRLTLNPVVIFLGLTFWGWLWGITGAVLAVPIMVVLKIFCDHSETLASVGEFMGGE